MTVAAMMNDNSNPDATAKPRPAGAIRRFAGPIALCIGSVAALAGFIGAPAAPWWMPLLLFVVAASVAWRLLRPPPRRIGWEDEV